MQKDQCALFHLKVLCIILNMQQLDNITYLLKTPAVVFFSSCWHFSAVRVVLFFRLVSSLSPPHLWIPPTLCVILIKQFKEEGLNYTKKYDLYLWGSNMHVCLKTETLSVVSVFRNQLFWDTTCLIIRNRKKNRWISQWNISVSYTW